MQQRQFQGQKGELIALTFLESKGFVLIARNWRCRFGEIDLIVERQGVIRFVEVKLRRTSEFGYPEASVTQQKLRHLTRAIECWLLEQRIDRRDYQIDVIAIYLPADGNMDVFWIEGVM